MTRILLVEDDLEMGQVTSDWLTEQGYEIELATNGVDALIAFGAGSFDAAAIDVMLPGMSGFEVCRHIRASGSLIPVILLTARDAVEDRIFGLDSGADDYLTKPFDLSELSARLRAMFRRESAGPQTLIRLGALELDSMKTKATVSGTTLSMSLREFGLLRMLAAAPGTPLSRVAILEELWGSAENIDPNIVEQYISFLRRKLEPTPSGVRIVTVRGRGYMLVESP
ncbi:MAG: two-component system regulatory protein [Glaciihabitans sp.]|nr:two-component system regulatory protein [Glaciihabitans sp.]